MIIVVTCFCSFLCVRVVRLRGVEGGTKRGEGEKIMYNIQRGVDERRRGEFEDYM